MNYSKGSVRTLEFVQNAISRFSAENLQNNPLATIPKCLRLRQNEWPASTVYFSPRRDEEVKNEK
jgi:hypothetical protein